MGTWPTLTAADLDLTVDTWDLTQTLSDTLGDLGTSADGFDSYVNDTVILLSSFGDLGGSLLDDLNLAAGIAASIDPTSLDADAASLPASLATGDAIAADAQALLNGVAPPPPVGGGGTGSGACGGAPIAPVAGKPNGGCDGTNTTVGCVFIDTFKRVDTTGQSRGVSYTNKTQRPVTIHSFTMDGGAPIFAGYNKSGPQPVPPGGVVVFTLAINPSIVGRWHSVLTLNSDDTDLQVRSMCVWLDVNTAGGGTGGGGGGGGGKKDI